MFTTYRQIFINEIKLTPVSHLLQVVWVGYYFLVIIVTIYVASATTREVLTFTIFLKSYLIYIYLCNFRLTQNLALGTGYRWYHSQNIAEQQRKRENYSKSKLQ